MGLAPTRLTAPSEDVEAVRRVALDYIEGYVTGDADRHARAYHPECIKRRFVTDADTGIAEMVVLSPRIMTDYAASVGGAHADADWEIVVDDISDGMAAVRVYSSDWVDFLHVAKARGEWKLLHVTWHGRGDG